MAKKTIRKKMYILLVVVALLLVGIFAFLQHPLFGKVPSGERLDRVLASPNYRDGEFKNLSETPQLAEGVSYYEVIKEMLFSNVKEMSPADSVPHVHTDLHGLADSSQSLIWFGHSSYFMQLDGVKYLVDPVLTKNASPLYGTNTAFLGTDLATSEVIPAIDYLLITHDHYDHLDYTTFKELKDRVAHIICPLGVAEHLIYWGYPESKITELDWTESVDLVDGAKITATPSRHFSGRGFKRNQSLWTSFVLKTKSSTIYIGGDSGYDSHFKRIGEQFGPFDLAILENGQYDRRWKYIHMLPPEVLKAGQDLEAQRILPVHSSKFKLANHPWKEPLELVTKLNDEGPKLNILTPKIGELVNLADTNQVFERWWK